MDVTKYNVKKYSGAGIYNGSTTNYVSNAQVHMLRVEINRE